MGLHFGRASTASTASTASKRVRNALNHLFRINDTYTIKEIVISSIRISILFGFVPFKYDQFFIVINRRKYFQAFCPMIRLDKRHKPVS